jgi:hypothetical protein
MEGLAAETGLVTFQQNSAEFLGQTAASRRPVGFRKVVSDQGVALDDNGKFGFTNCHWPVPAAWSCDYPESTARKD